MFIVPTEHSGDHDGRISGNTTALNDLCTFWKSYRRLVEIITFQDAIVYFLPLRIVFGVCYRGFREFKSRLHRSSDHRGVVSRYLELQEDLRSCVLTFRRLSKKDLSTTVLGHFGLPTGRNFIVCIILRTLLTRISRYWSLCLESRVIGAAREF